MSAAKVIVVLVGIPGAGKTTFSNAFKTHFDEYQVTIFHYDELCKTFTSDERKCVLTLVEKQLSNCISEETREKPNIVIIDDNNYYKSMRYQYLQMCRKNKWGFVVIYLKIEVETALERNKMRRTVPDDIIKQMFVKLEVPVESENVIHIVSECRNFNVIKTTIEHAIANPQFSFVTDSDSKITITTTSFLQRIDLVLRKIVHGKIKENITKSREYNRIKKDLFSYIKHGKICVSQCSEEELAFELSKYFD